MNNSPLEERKLYTPIPTKWKNKWARWRAVNANSVLVEYELKPFVEETFWKCSGGNNQVISSGHDTTNWEESLEERPRKTRPMTAREFARFVGENLGKYLYCPSSSLEEDFWTYAPVIINKPNTKEWLYAHNEPGELIWMELPRVED